MAGMALAAKSRSKMVIMLLKKDFLTTRSS